jgi:hypothetical protein
MRRSALLLVLAQLCVPAFAVTDALDAGLRKCASMTDQTARLACFDALAASLPKVEADRIGMTAAIDQKRKAEAANRAPPGNPPGRVDTASPGNAVSAAPIAPPPAGDALTAKIVSVAENARGLMIFSLDNDQVWIQDQPSINIKFSAGDSVRIKRGALSALWLEADHGRKTRVKRLR